MGDGLVLRTVGSLRIPFRYRHRLCMICLIRFDFAGPLLSQTIITQMVKSPLLSTQSLALASGWNSLPTLSVTSFNVFPAHSKSDMSRYTWADILAQKLPPKMKSAINVL